MRRKVHLATVYQPSCFWAVSLPRQSELVLWRMIARLWVRSPRCRHFLTLRLIGRDLPPLLRVGDSVGMVRCAVLRAPDSGLSSPVFHCLATRLRGVRDAPLNNRVGNPDSVRAVAV